MLISLYSSDFSPLESLFLKKIFLIFWL